MTTPTYYDPVSMALSDPIRQKLSRNRFKFLRACEKALDTITLGLLRAADRPLSLDQIEAVTGIHPAITGASLYRLMKAGDVTPFQPASFEEDGSFRPALYTASPYEDEPC